MTPLDKWLEEVKQRRWELYDKWTLVSRNWNGKSPYDVQGIGHYEPCSTDEDQIVHVSDHAFVELLLSDLERAVKVIEAYEKAMEYLSRCSGGCEGPVGCMCKAPAARQALADAQKIVEGE